MTWFKKRDRQPTAEHAARRLVILKHVVVSALVAPPRDMLREIASKWDAGERAAFESKSESQRDSFWKPLQKAGLWPQVSPKERKLASSTAATMTQQQQVDATWRMEGVQTLMWALRLLPELPPYDTAADHDLLETIPSRDVPAFLLAATLRGREELDRARSTAELWHWRSRTRDLIERGAPFPDAPQIKAVGFHDYDDLVRFTARKGAENGTLSPCVDGDFPARGKAYRDLTAIEWSEVRSITIERHFALNWLCGRAPGNRWDETPTDT